MTENRSVHQGLSSQEARKILEEVGPNRLVPPSPHGIFRDLVRALGDPMALMLIVAGSLYFFLGDRLDGWILFGALIPVAGVDVFLELRTEKAIDALKSAFAPFARVIRDGVEKPIPAEELVPGDLVVMREGDVPQADGVLVETRNFLVNESVLTGESEPILKNADPDGSATVFFAGSTVVSGEALGRVTQTGLNTSYGKISKLVAATARTETPLQGQIHGLVRRLGVLALGLAVLVFGWSWGLRGDWKTALIAAISFGMSAMPEEFPMVFTLFLSAGAWRLSRRQVLIRELAGVETLGSTSVICTDKTGTLTENRFRLAEVRALDGAQELLSYAVLGCEPEVSDAMDKAIHDFAKESGTNPQEFMKGWALRQDHPFDPVGRHMSHVWQRLDPASSALWRVSAKGAIEGILEHCHSRPEERRQAIHLNEELAGQGYRVLALAGKDLQECPKDRLDAEKDLRLFALLGFRDPVRPGIRESIERCQHAGIRIKMVTGDHLLTAHAVAEAIGLVHHHEPVPTLMTGAEFEKLPEAERKMAAQRCSIFARVSAEQKFELVDALRKAGEVVAVTGDGVNDAPALRRADIGISMGAGATEVARKSAAMVLLNDDFNSIAVAVFEGRRIFENIRKAFRYLVAFHVPIFLGAAVIPVLRIPFFLLPVHLVWLELIVHPVSALLFESEPASPDLMRRAPRPRDEGIIGRASFLLSLLTGITLGALVLWVYMQGASGAKTEQDVLVARTLALTGLIIGCLVLIWVERCGNEPFWKVPLPRSKNFWLIFFGIALSLPVFVHTPIFNRILMLTPLSREEWVKALVMGAAGVGWRFLWGILSHQFSDRTNNKG